MKRAIPFVKPREPQMRFEETFSAETVVLRTFFNQVVDPRPPQIADERDESPAYEE